MKPPGAICTVTRFLVPFAFGCGLVVCTPAGRADVSTGLVASYALGGDAGDGSGNGNNGTVSGAVPTADRDGRANGATRFNGQSASIVVPSSSSLAVTGSQLTMAAWVRVDAGADFSAGWVRFLSKGATQGFYYSDYSLGFDSSGRLTAEFSNSGGIGATGGVVSSGAALSRGAWHHVAATFSSGAVRLYVDGSLAASETASQPTLNASARTLVLGGRTQNGTDHQFFAGDLDDVLIFRRALSASDVAELAAPNQTDPGEASKLTLVSGTVAGQTVSPSSRSVTVAPGQPLVGQLNVRIDSAWPANAVMAMGVTPSWGSHATSYRDLGGFSTPVTGLVRTVPIDLTAPATPGTYAITAAYGAQYTAAQVMSATSWTVGPGTWNDGNDVADWPAAMLSTANANGTVQASILYPSGFVPYFVPATAITVVVQAPPTCTSFTISPSSASAADQAGSAAVSLTGAPAGCQGGSWTASGNGSWLTVSPTSGAGSGSGGVTVFWTANAGPAARSGSVTIAGQTFSVSQAAPVSPADPGETSKLTLVGGTLAGQTVSPSSRTVTVAPGQPLAGQLDVRIDSAWPANAVMAMGVTPSWGSHATSYRDLGGFSTPVTGLVRTVPIDLTAPATPGTYAVTAAYGAQYTAAQVMSATSWTVGAGTWNDGNDVADWTSSMRASANANGTVQSSVLYPSGFVPFFVPATAIEVVVQEVPPAGGPRLTAGSASLCGGQSVVVPLSLAGQASPLAIQFDVTFDPAKLSVTAVQTGSLTTGFSISSGGSSGRVRVAMASGSPAASPSGEVARLTVQGVSGLGTGTTAVVGVENVTVNDTAGTGGPGTLACSARRKGDVNGNGSVSAFDASLILQAVVGSLAFDADQSWAADFNSNGSVTAYDASLVLQCVVNGSCP